MSIIDNKIYRSTVANIPTSVIIVTTHLDGVDYGITVGSFHSISANRLIVGWCSNSTFYGDIFRRAKSFVIHGMAEGQADLALVFSRNKDRKFEGITPERDHLNNPILKDCLVSFSCDSINPTDLEGTILFNGLMTHVHYVNSEKKALTHFQSKFNITG